MATSAAAPGSDTEQQVWMSNRRQFLAGLVLALSNFMVVLDLTIANVSVPHIAGNLGITLDQGTWIITSYAVAEAICVPLTGWLAMRYGTVRVFIFAMAGFGVFSALCGLSPTLGALVACRIGQGFAGAPLMPASQALLLRVFPPERRPAAIAIWSLTVLLGPALGPILGGYISDQYSWHWIFLINVPIAIICAGVGFVLLRPVETATRQLPIDRAGLVLLVFWIGCLQLMLDLGRDRDWFADPMIVALGICTVVGFCVFVIWELTEEHPVVDLRVFRHRGFSTSVAAMSLVFSAYFAGIVAIPQWLQTSMGYTATLAGLTTAFTALFAILVVPIVPRLMKSMDPRLMVCIAVLNMEAMTLARTGWSNSASFLDLAWPQMVQGLGMPLFMVPLTQLSLGSVDPDEVASAAGLQNFMRTMAVAVSTSVVLTIWGDHTRLATNRMVETLQPDATLATLDQAGLGPEMSRQVIDNLVQQQATTMALEHTFLVAAIVLGIAACAIWFVPRPAGPMNTMQTGH